MKKVTASPLNVWKFIQGNPQGVKRMVKVAITLSGGIALTINHPLVDIWGGNPFLLGTTVSTLLLVFEKWGSDILWECS